MHMKLPEKIILLDLQKTEDYMIYLQLLMLPNIFLTITDLELGLGESQDSTMKIERSLSMTEQKLM